MQPALSCRPTRVGSQGSSLPDRKLEGRACELAMRRDATAKLTVDLNTARCQSRSHLTQMHIFITLANTTLRVWDNSPFCPLAILFCPFPRRETEGIKGGSNQGSEPRIAVWITEHTTLVSLLTNRRPPESKSRWIKDKFPDGQGDRT